MTHMCAQRGTVLMLHVCNYRLFDIAIEAMKRSVKQRIRFKIHTVSSILFILYVAE